jgi:hypothetical protein
MTTPESGIEAKISHSEFGAVAPDHNLQNILIDRLSLYYIVLDSIGSNGLTDSTYRYGCVPS